MNPPSAKQYAPNILSAAQLNRLAAWLPFSKSTIQLENRFSLSKKVARRLRGGEAAIFRIAVRVGGLDGGRSGIVLPYLRDAARARLAARVRPSDVLGEVGADDYVLATPVGGVGFSADAFADRILQALSAPVATPFGDAFPRVNLGYASAPATQAGGAFSRAEAALMLAMRRGAGFLAPAYGDSAHLFDSEAGRLGVQYLRRIIDADGLFPVYQPICALKDGQVGGFETLMRARSEDGGTLTPGSFIPTAESSGMILELGRKALDQAAAAAAVFAKTGPGRRIRVAVNVSAGQLRSGDLAADISEACDLHGVAPDLLTVEITETAVIEDMAAAKATLNRVRALGAKIALDDFGAGYCSLGYLRDLPVDVVKIDSAYVDGFPASGRSAVILRKMVEMVQDLGARTVAEGVRTKVEWAALRDLGVDYAQGSYCGAPMRLEDAIERLRPPRLVKLAVGE